MENLNENKTLSEILKDKIREHKVSIKKLSEVSGISKRHLENLIAGRYEKMPPSPYLHGYVEKLGQLLNFDSEKYWQELKKQDMVFSSGKTDVMPKNRFAYQKTEKRVIIAIIIIVLFAIYFTLNYNTIFGEPTLILNMPGSGQVVSDTSQYIISGKVKNADFLYVNGEKIMFSSGGDFSQAVSLSPGLNTIAIKAVKFLGQEKTVNEMVNFLVPSSSQSTSSVK